MTEKVKKKRNWNIELGGVSSRDILFFTKHLTVALKAGLTLIDGLSMLEDQAVGKMKSIIHSVSESIRSGNRFHTSLAQYPKYFSPIYINLIKTGEIAGTLEKNLNYLVRQLEKEQELKRKIKSAMMYPMMIFVAVICLGLSVAVFVLPKIVPLFKTLNVKLPLSTRVLIWIAEVFGNHGIVILIGTVGGMIFLTWFLKLEFVKPVTHRIFLLTPVVKGIVQNVNLQCFTQTLGTLLTSGIPIDISLQVTSDISSNNLYKKAIASFVLEIQKGHKLAQACLMYPKLFPKITVHMINMAEETGDLDNTLKYLSEFYESEVDSTMKNLSTILEPLLLIFIGFLVGAVAISILGPIYQITGNLRG